MLRESFNGIFDNSYMRAYCRQVNQSWIGALSFVILPHSGYVYAKGATSFGLELLCLSSICKIDLTQKAP